jgi:hypothetical protein
MNTGLIKRTSLGATAALLLAGCGGGGPIAGISGTGITSSGTITGFGSVIVNGVRFDTDDANIIVNGMPATEADLRVGQVVTVTGTLEDKTNAVAQSIVFDRVLDGPVESVNPQGDVLVVTALEQSVIINELTRFVNATPEDLATGNLVAVSGFIDERGQIVATLVQRALQEFPYGTGVQTDVEGTVSGLDEAANTFNVGMLSVDYSNASVIEVSGNLSNGALVEVFGTQSAPGGIFTASTVRVLDPKPLDEAEARVELEGIVADFNGLGDFTISGQPVDASTATQRGNTGLALGPGVRVEVEGSINDAGVLVAETFLIKRVSDILVAGNVASVDG